MFSDMPKELQEIYLYMATGCKAIENHFKHTTVYGAYTAHCNVKGIADHPKALKEIQHQLINIMVNV